MEYNKQDAKTQEEQETCQIQIKYDKKNEETQTEAKFINNSPRKTKLKGKIHSLQKKLHKLKQQLKRQKNNIKNCVDQFSIEEYCNITDQLLPPTIATFVKTQVQFSHKFSKGRRYSDEFKIFYHYSFFVNIYL